MNIDSVFTVAMLLMFIASFAMSAGLSRRRDFGIGDSVFIECGSKGC